MMEIRLCVELALHFQIMIDYEWLIITQQKEMFA